MVEIDDDKDCASTSSLHRLLDPAIPSNENVSTALSEPPKSENLKTNSSVTPPYVPSSTSSLSTTTLATQPCLSTSSTLQCSTSNSAHILTIPSTPPCALRTSAFVHSSS